MPYTIRENQKMVSKQDPSQLLNYAVRESEIIIDETEKKLKIYMSNKEEFCNLLEVFDYLYKEARKKNLRVPFKTNYTVSTNTFKFKKNIEEALKFLKIQNVISDVTYDDALSYLLENSERKESVVSSGLRNNPGTK